MDRREFIKQTSIAGAAIGTGALSLSVHEPLKKHITILHTNDVHSHVDSFGPNAGRNANKGGVARRATLINKIRKENKNTLLLDAGDIFQGTPYFNYYGGELEFKLMSMLKYDAATIGNHDFDNGIDGLYSQLPHAEFDFISANYDFTNTVLDGHVKAYKIFNLDGIKIGVFGLGIELNGLVTKVLYKETQYLDPYEITTDIVSELKHTKKCDLIICLSHLGYNYDKSNKISDMKLAENSENIDLIIGGHTHTFLDKPTVVNNIKGKPVIVNQVGCYGLYLGRIDFYLNADRSKTGSGISINI